MNATVKRYSEFELGDMLVTPDSGVIRLLAKPELMPGSYTVVIAHGIDENGAVNWYQFPPFREFFYCK